jgi:hypothetical protein
MALNAPGTVVSFVDAGSNTQYGVVIKNDGAVNVVAYHFMAYPGKDHQKAAKEFSTSSTTLVSFEAN